MMDNNNSMVKTVLNNFIDDYMKRDQNVEFSEWLGNKLRGEIQSLDDDSSKELVDKIMDAVLDYDKNLEGLNHAVENGKTKEKWFAEKMAESYEGMDIQEMGDILSDFEDELSEATKNSLYDENEESVSDYNESDTSVEWNKYSIKDMLGRIARKAAVFGLGNVAKAMENKALGVENSDDNEFQEDLLKKCLKNDNEEVKAAIAGALEVVAVNKLNDKLPSDTPVEVICDLAGGVVDAAEVAVDLIDGNVTKTEAVEKIARTGIAAWCRVGCHYLKYKIATIPTVGPICVDLLGGLFEHMEGPVFADNVYKTVHDAAVATWEGIKENIGHKIKALGDGIELIQ
jgi:rhodanese-related sulfurtransferase